MKRKKYLSVFNDILIITSETLSLPKLTQLLRSELER